MKKEKAEQIIRDRLKNGLTIRSLANKYGIPTTSIHRIVKKQPPPYTDKPLQEELPDEISVLRSLLRKERLKNELLNNMIDIADKELGTNIRKKSGTRRSE